jgi:AGZA family xanthine/uracil permease-like MFS transporter
MVKLIERLFRLRENGTTINVEIVAGITTFMTMAYIIFVQPAILSLCGMDFGAVMTATCVSSAVACFLMGLMANLPIALAPAMGHNVYFVFIACPLIAKIIGPDSRINPWQVALGAVFISGAVFMISSLWGIRSKIISAVPSSLRNAIAVGIGLLISLVGFEWSGLTVSDPSILIKLGKINSPPVLLSLFGLALISVLMARKVRGAILIGMLATALAGIPLGLVKYSGIISKVPSLAPTFLKLDLRNACGIGFLEIIFVFFFLDLFDTVGTLIGVSEKGGLMKNGTLPNAEKALFSDACATVTGSLLGTSTVTSYVESASGISAGGKTGLTSIVTGILMLLSLFLAPLAKMVGGGCLIGEGIRLYPVIAPALIIVGCMMMSCVKKIEWDDLTEAIPSFLTIAVMPFCGFSITEGISFGFISYSILKIATGKGRDVNWIIYLFSALFLLRYIYFK